MKRQDITTRGGFPSINVKCYDFGPTAESVMREFKCERSDAERALGYAWDSAQEQFWETIGRVVDEIFPGAECYSDGRSGGWLVVRGLPGVDSWDAVVIGKWSKLARITREEIAYLSGVAYSIGLIEANRWAEPGSEQFNFVNDGNCLVDLKRKAIAAGFSAVVRV